MSHTGRLRRLMSGGSRRGEHADGGAAFGLICIRALSRNGIFNLSRSLTTVLELLQA
jgi:hypothetical protein